ncbi:hypothetical protein [Paraburkholderia sediminicola]|uniref:hypothetical protein n=1 Tax=Paraburkholderia sediminicola TaxID=458836 RepID=UPI001581C13A|nr:hypothetical protein [Paraburkholderia sediminicola]
MTEVEADRLTQEALRTARARAGDSVSATTTELLRMMHFDAQLQLAFAVLSIARLQESQKLRH